jgi:hypothetical protein
MVGITLFARRMLGRGPAAAERGVSVAAMLWNEFKKPLERSVGEIKVT